MCIKNLNVNTITFIRPNIGSQDMRLFDKITVDTVDPVRISNFNVLVFLTAIVEKKDTNHATTCIVEDEEYDVLIRLNNISTQYGVDILKFSFRTDDSSLKETDIKFFETRNIASFSKFEFPKGEGTYEIKAFVKNKSDTKWYLQCVQPFSVEVRR